MTDTAEHGPRLAFLGLGAMGSRMAGRLGESGYDLVVWNRSPAAAEPLAVKGARVAVTPAEAAAGADIVLSMVTDDAAARAVWLGQDGALAAMREGALAVEMSTVSGEWVAALGNAASERNVRLIDAPVAGSRPHAEAGTLSFLVGGDAEDLAAFDSVARAMGQLVIHAGPLGQGTVLKMMVNGLLAVQTAALAELLGYGDSNGLAPSAAMEMLAQIPVTSPAAQVVGGQIASGAHEPMFTVDLLVKDLGYLLNGSEAAVLGAVQESFAAAQARGLGGQHISAVAA